MTEKVLLLLVLLLSAAAGFTQTDTNPESFTQLPDDVFKREIATFSRKARSFGYSDSAAVQLNEIGMRSSVKRA